MIYALANLFVKLFKIDFGTAKSVARITLVALGLLAVLLIGGLIFTKCGDWRGRSREQKMKANINAALSNIEDRNRLMANLKEQQAAETAVVNAATKDYLDATNASDAARRETDAAIKRMQEQTANGNISAEELREKLRGL